MRPLFLVERALATVGLIYPMQLHVLHRNLQLDVLSLAWQRKRQTISEPNMSAITLVDKVKAAG
jgi:hypothetical protein